MSEEFIKVTDTRTDRQTELLPELLVGANKDRRSLKFATNPKIVKMQIGSRSRY